MKPHPRKGDKSSPGFKEEDQEQVSEVPSFPFLEIEI